MLLLPPSPAPPSAPFQPRSPFSVRNRDLLGRALDHRRVSAAIHAIHASCTARLVPGFAALWRDSRNISRAGATKFAPAAVAGVLLVYQPSSRLVVGAPLVAIETPLVVEVLLAVETPLLAIETPLAIDTPLAVEVLLAGGDPLGHRAVPPLAVDVLLAIARPCRLETVGHRPIQFRSVGVLLAVEDHLGPRPVQPHVVRVLLVVEDPVGHHSVQLLAIQVLLAIEDGLGHCSVQALVGGVVLAVEVPRLDPLLVAGSILVDPTVRIQPHVQHTAVGALPRRGPVYALVVGTFLGDPDHLVPPQTV